MAFIKNQLYLFCRNVPRNQATYQYCYILQKLRQTQSFWMDQFFNFYTIRPEKCHMFWAKFTQLLYYIIVKKMVFIKNQLCLFCQNVPRNQAIYQYCYIQQKLRQTQSFLADGFYSLFFGQFSSNIKVVLLFQSLILTLIGFPILKWLKLMLSLYLCFDLCCSWNGMHDYNWWIKREKLLSLFIFSSSFAYFKYLTLNFIFRPAE